MKVLADALKILVYSLGSLLLISFIFLCMNFFYVLSINSIPFSTEVIEFSLLRESLIIYNKYLPSLLILSLLVASGMLKRFIRYSVLSFLLQLLFVFSVLYFLLPLLQEQSTLSQKEDSRPFFLIEGIYTPIGDTAILFAEFDGEKLASIVEIKKSSSSSASGTMLEYYPHGTIDTVRQQLTLSNYRVLLFHQKNPYMGRNLQVPDLLQYLIMDSQIFRNYISALFEQHWLYLFLGIFSLSFLFVSIPVCFRAYDWVLVSFVFTGAFYRLFLLSFRYLFSHLSRTLIPTLTDSQLLYFPASFLALSFLLLASGFFMKLKTKGRAV